MSTRGEIETVIIVNDEDEFATVDTMHARFRRACEEVIRRTGRGRERNPDHGIRDGRKVRWEFEVPKEAIAVPRVPREATEAQRAAARENMARLREIARQPAEIGAPDAAGTAEGPDLARLRGIAPDAALGPSTPGDSEPVSGLGAALGPQRPGEGKR
jgi:hypothetical protein